MSTGTPWPSKSSKPKLHCAGASPACAASPNQAAAAAWSILMPASHAPIGNHAPLLLRRGITSFCLRLHHSTDGTELFDTYVPHVGFFVAGLDLECYGRKLAQPWLGFHDRMCLETLDGGPNDTMTKVRFSIETRAIADGVP